MGEDDRCADGSKWPATQAEVEAWCRRIEELPALFDDEADRMEFENRMLEMRVEEASTLAARDERVAKLFRS